MSSDGDTIRVECRICSKMYSFIEMQQILPCFHLFCGGCITILTSYQKINQADNNRKSKKFSTDVLTCPAINCYSQIRDALTDSLTFTINYCDNIMCPKKLSQFESTRLIACQHELCTACLEESLQRQPPTCIVENCNRNIIEVEDAYFCDSCNKQMDDPKTLIATNCCKCHFCEQCVKNRVNMGSLNKETLICTDGKCLSKKKIESEEVQVMCKVKNDCEHIALNGFPSNSECSHDVCIECLTDMISDCEASGVAPMCPHPLCRQYYTIESVNALCALFPQKAEFFQRFDLSERKTELFCRDDSVTFVHLSSDFDFASRHMTVRVMADSDEEAEEILIYDKQGTIGDFIREVRRVLKILPYEKIYGYFIKREDNGKDENEADQEIATDAASLAKRISELQLTSTSIVHVDTAGIVQRKSSKKTDNSK